MSDVQQSAVDQHEHGFENPEEPFVSYDEREGSGVDVVVQGMNAGEGEVFDCSVDRADEDEGGAHVQRQKHGVEVCGEEVRTTAAPLKIDC